jgi:hypothetical protein
VDNARKTPLTSALAFGLLREVRLPNVNPCLS